MKAPSRRDRIRAQLADLKMSGALEALDQILSGIDGGTLGAPEAIENLLGAQISLRNNRRLQAAMRSSRLPAVKMLSDFDFTFQPSIKREQIRLSRWTLAAWRKSGFGPAYLRLKGNDIRYPEDRFQEWIEGRTVSSIAEERRQGQEFSGSARGGFK